MKSFPGKIVGKVFEVRFPFSGQVAWVGKSAGEKVSKGELLASMDKKALQTDLDRQLADYERIRAEFDFFQTKAEDETTKSVRQQKQSALNVSVKDVESAKQKLDQADLFSPVDGIIMESENLVPGLNITPANSALKILDSNSLNFVFSITQDQIALFIDGVDIKIKFKEPKLEISAKTSPLLFGQDGKFVVWAKIDKADNLIAGLSGEAILQG